MVPQNGKKMHYLRHQSIMKQNNNYDLPTVKAATTLIQNGPPLFSALNCRSRRRVRVLLGYNCQYP